MQNAADDGNMAEFTRLHATLTGPCEAFLAEAESLFGIQS